MTLWEFMKESWTIKKKRIKELGINPNKEARLTTWDEFKILASELDITVGKLIQLMKEKIEQRLLEQKKRVLALIPKGNVREKALIKSFENIEKLSYKLMKN